MTTFGGKTVPPLFEAISGSFTIGPIRFLDSDESFSAVAGNNRNFGMTWFASLPVAGSQKFGDSFAPIFQNSFMTDRPQWHEDEPTAATGGNNGTFNFAIALLQILEEPVDLPVRWPQEFQVPILGTFFDMVNGPTLVIRTLAGDPAGFRRVFEGIFAIRRRSNLELMAQATVRFTAIRT